MKTCSTTFHALLMAVAAVISITSAAETTTLIACDKKCKNDAHKLFAQCMPTSDPFVLDENGLGYRRRNLRQADEEHRDLQDCTYCEENVDPICCIIPWCSYTCGGGCQNCGHDRRKLSTADIAEHCEDLFYDVCKDKDDKDKKDKDKVTCTVTVYDMSPQELAEKAAAELPP